MSNEADIINATIKVDQIDKSLLYQGRQAKYLDLVLIPTPDNQYGNTHMVVQGVSKEKREAGEKGPIVGNAKILKRKQSPAQQPAKKQDPLPLADDFEDEDIPF